MFSFDGVNDGVNQRLIQFVQIVSVTKNDVGGILDLPDTPMETRAEVTDDGAVQASKAVEPSVKLTGRKNIGELLGGVKVVDMHKGVIEQVKSYASLFQLES